MLRATILVVVAFCLVAAPASADARSGSITFAPPENTPSFEPQPPETQQGQYVERLTAAYDTNGTVTLTMRLYDAVYWGDNMPDVNIGMDAEEPCGYYDGSTLSGFARREPGEEGFDPETGAPTPAVPYFVASVDRKGYEGEAPGNVVFDGQTFTITYTHPALAGLDLRCVDIGVWDARNSGGSFYFDGFEPPEPFVVGASSATREWKAHLARTRGYRRGYAKCPRQEVFAIERGEPKQAFCMAQYKVGKQWRYYNGIVSVKNELPSVKVSFTRRWVRRWHGCRKPRWARDMAPGRLRSNGACDFLMASDVHYFLRSNRKPRNVGYHGTNLAGFETLARFKCHKRRRSATCRNALGDAFRYVERR